jgi:enamine deaminase RidA (YjgF/YER057c/UK114 family)
MYFLQYRGCKLCFIVDLKLFPFCKHQIFGIVQSTDDFKEQHKVMDGCSDLMMEVFGKSVGYHARSAIGTNTLPLDISVEVEAIVQIIE